MNRVLVIGGKLRFLFESISASYKDCPVAFLSEDAYDIRFVTYYLKCFDLVVSPYRFCLLHLSVERERLGDGPFLALVTGALSHLEVIGVCDEVCGSSDVF